MCLKKIDFLSAILVKRTDPFLRSNIPQTATATLDTYDFYFQIDCYEYLHSKGYVHKDVKGSNLLFARGANRSKKYKVYLVDYGLTSRFIHIGGLHKPFKPDIRSAHEGTLLK
jgi:serine/threonine protein kinase